jgi:NADPH:quinone reductase-like Zn-dependent oxidoreductase
MKAVRSHVRGGPESLVYKDAPIPHISAGEVLVHVHAVSITPTEFTWNSTWTSSDGNDRRLIVLSFEVSGVVEKITTDGSDLTVGDAVYVFEPAPLRGASTINIEGR